MSRKKFAVHTQSKLVQILISFLTQKKIHKLGISIISQKKLTYSIAKLYNSLKKNLIPAVKSFKCYLYADRVLTT